jgi:molybdate transport system regulatory protein
VSARRHDLHLRVKLGKTDAFGPGKAALLEGIRQSGSIAQAGRSMKMSYARAWRLVQAMNGEFRAPLVRSAKGGAARGGATLTALGEQVSGTCSVFGVNNFTGLNRDVFAGPINKGSYCMQAFDPGSLTAAQNYTLQISHP